MDGVEYQTLGPVAEASTGRGRKGTRLNEAATESPLYLERGRGIAVGPASAPQPDTLSAVSQQRVKRRDQR